MATEPPAEEPVEPSAEKDQGPPERRIPPWLGWVLTIFVVAFVAAFISLAFKSSKSPAAPGGDEKTPVDGPATTGSSEAFRTCGDCHGSFDNVLTNGSPIDQLLNYTHDQHFKKMSDCSMCHPLPAHEPDKINKPTMGRCFVCHGTAKTAIAPGNCQTCHPPGSPTVPGTHTQGNWLKDHPEAALSDPFECASCHEQNFCQNCHGLPVMPHPEGWKDTEHIQTFFKVGFPVCQNCHDVGSTPQQDLAQKGPDFCDQCHHEWGPKNTSWIKYHPTVVDQPGAAQTCFQCHNPSTCATCHVKGQEDLSADRVNFNVSAPPDATASSAPSPAASRSAPASATPAG